MKTTAILFVIAVINIALISLYAAGVAKAAGMPASFYSAMDDMRTENFLCVKNYEAGASVTESYTDFEYLQKETQIVSKSRRNSTDKAVLEASINSEVIGTAHIAWQSRDPLADSWGRHAILSRSSDDLTGVFSVEKFLQLWSNSTIEGLGIDWLPCD
jgi:hypothetical protein